MFDELFDLFDRKRRHGRHKPSLLDRILGRFTDRGRPSRHGSFPGYEERRSYRRHDDDRRIAVGRRRRDDRDDDDD